MITLRDKLEDRIIAEKHYYNKEGNHKGIVFTCPCPIKDCNRTVKIGKHQEIDKLCRSCAAKNSISEKRHWEIRTKDINLTKQKVKYPERFLREEESDIGSVRIYYSCISCKKPALDSYCHKCSNKNKRKQPYERTFNKLIKSSKKRNINCELSFEEFQTFCEIEKCHYCHEHLNRAKYKSENGSDAVFLDRKDSQHGYTVSNCVPCCGRCNNMKGHLITYNEMVMIWHRRFKNQKILPGDTEV